MPQSGNSPGAPPSQIPSEKPFFPLQISRILKSINHVEVFSEDAQERVPLCKQQHSPLALYEDDHQSQKISAMLQSVSLYAAALPGASDNDDKNDDKGPRKVW